MRPIFRRRFRRLLWMPLVMAAACIRTGAPPAAMPQESPEPSDITGEAWRWADSTASRMTLEEKVGQLFMPAVYASADGATLRLLRGYVADCHVGGIVLLKGTLEEAALLADTLASMSPTGLFIAIDAEWGLSMRLDGAPEFPDNCRLGATADELMMYDYGREMARECRLTGINMLLGPVVDVVESRRSVIGRRSFGADPHRVADLAVAYARGVESGGVLSVAKHFPGHGSPAVDSHKQLPVIERGFEALDSIDLYPFRRYIEAGLSGVMVGHLAVSAVDTLRRPAAMSPPVVSGLLIGRMGFRGLVLTDALNMGGAAGYEAWRALAAGADIVVAPAATGEAVASTLEALRDGTLSIEAVERACRKVLFYKYLVGADKRRRIDRRGLAGDVASPEAADVQRRLLSE